VTAIIVPIATALLTLAGGWLITTRVSDHWQGVQQRRESGLAAAAEFQRLYGEFFAVWKVWNATMRYRDQMPPEPPDLVWNLLSRAAAMEAGVEALLTQVSATHVLTEPEIAAFGALRQGFQQLRTAMQRRQMLDWWGSDVPDYLAFKDLATFASQFFGRPRTAALPSGAAAANNFRAITSNRFERRWVAEAQRLFPATAESAQ
jgi:hypothetical protein